MMASVEEMAQQLEPWSAERVRQLDGTLRGSLLRNWGGHVVRREGLAGVDAVRTATGVTNAMLPDAPDLKAWYPLWYQIALTDEIVARFLGGDYLALEALLLEDGQRARDKAVRWIIARVGPATVFRKAAAGHAELMTVGTVSSTVEKKRAHLVWRGAEVFENPTWRLLQMMAVRLMMGVMNKTVVEQQATGLLDSNGFSMDVRWR